MSVKFYLGQNKDCCPGARTSNSSEKLFQRDRGERSLCMWFQEEGIHAIKPIFFQKISTSLMKLCLSWGTVITFKDFSAFPNMRRYKNWAHKIGSWKRLTIWGSVFSVFPRAPHFRSPPWTPFRRCWRSAAAATHALILVEVDGRSLGMCRLVVETGKDSKP